MFSTSGPSQGQPPYKPRMFRHIMCRLQGPHHQTPCVSRTTRLALARLPVVPRPARARPRPARLVLRHGVAVAVALHGAYPARGVPAAAREGPREGRGTVVPAVVQPRGHPRVVARVMPGTGYGVRMRLATSKRQDTRQQARVSAFAYVISNRGRRPRKVLHCKPILSKSGRIRSNSTQLCGIWVDFGRSG